MMEDMWHGTKTSVGNYSAQNDLKSRGFESRRAIFK